MTEFYELGLTPGVKLAERSFFRARVCPSCGGHLTEQVIDLALVTEPEDVDLPGVLVTPGGHLVVRREVHDELGRLGLVGSSRSATVGDSPPGAWFHVEPKAAVSLVQSSLRGAPEWCDSCGGRVRPTFDGRWIVDAGSETGFLASVRGASQIKVASSDVADKLRQLAPGVELRPLSRSGTERTPDDDPHGWGDL